MHLLPGILPGATVISSKMFVKFKSEHFCSRMKCIVFVV